MTKIAFWGLALTGLISATGPASAETPPQPRSTYLIGVRFTDTDPAVRSTPPPLLKIVEGGKASVRADGEHGYEIAAALQPRGDKEDLTLSISECRRER